MNDTELTKLLKRQATQTAEVAVSKSVSESEQRMQRYIGVIKKDFDHKIDMVLELVQDIPAIKTKLDLTFVKVGEIAIDVEVIKETVKDHEVRLQKLEAR